MSKFQSIVILPAEEEGWDVWGMQSGAISHVESLSALSNTSEASEKRLALAVRQVITLPLTVPSLDKDILRNAVQLELESAAMAENLAETWDVLMIAQDQDQSCVSALQMLEGTLDFNETLNHFKIDFSARYYKPSIDDDSIALWKESGQWGLAFYRCGVAFFVEPIDAPLSIVSALPVYKAQLSYKGIEFTPREVLLWSEVENEEALAFQLVSADLYLKVEPKPAPSFPEEALKIRHSSVAKWERNTKQKEKLRGIIIAVAALYLGVLLSAWFVFQNADQQVKDLEQEIQSHTPQWKENQQHFEAWKALAPVVKKDWPLELYQSCVLCLPKGSDIRLTSVKVEGESIELKGESKYTAKLNTFRARLKSSAQFQEYKWEMPPEKQSLKTKLWEFHYTAKPKVYEEE